MTEPEPLPRAERKPLPVIREDNDGADYVAIPPTVCLMIDRMLVRKDDDEWITILRGLGERQDLPTIMRGLDERDLDSVHSNMTRQLLRGVRRKVTMGLKSGLRWRRDDYGEHIHRTFARLLFLAFNEVQPSGKLRHWTLERGGAIAGWGGLSVVDLLVISIDA
jgi:hypothetical protein